MDDRYLWDRTGPADPEVERLEDLLGRFRRESLAPLRMPAPRPIPKSAATRALAAAAAVLVAAAGILWFVRSGAARPWRVERVSGQPRVEATPVSDSVVSLRVGQAIQTDAGSRAKIGVGGFARIAVGPDSSVRLVKSGPVEQRLALGRGTISARIWAPPRLFLVETPSALAVDLGCAYTLEADSEGTGLLRVETGWVSFERDGRESIVPAGAACATRARQGPGTPYFEDSPSELRRALEVYDFAGGGPDALSTILVAARRRDGLTLWHLIRRAPRPDRERLYERLAALVPAPPGVTREGALRGDRRILELWRRELDGMPPFPRPGSFLSFWRKLWFSIAATEPAPSVNGRRSLPS